MLEGFAILGLVLLAAVLVLAKARGRLRTPGARRSQAGEAVAPKAHSSDGRAPGDGGDRRD